MKLLAAALLVVLTGASLPAVAATSLPSVPSSMKASFAAGDHARDGGVLSGKVVGVDYVRGVMSLRTDNHTTDVYVLPSTSIQGKTSGYYTISDLKKGTSVEVFTSIAGSRTNAQIIKLK
jgi:hypothetical protein